MHFALVLGLAQIVKYSMIHLVIFFGYCFGFCFDKKRNTDQRNRMEFDSVNCSWELLCYSSSILDFFLITREKGWMNFKCASQTFTGLQNSFIGSIPLPLPAPYIEGLDLTTYMNELGAGDPNVSDANYILGQKRTGTGFWYYYLVVFIFKTPLTALLILVGAITFSICKKEKAGTSQHNAFFTWLDLLFFTCTGFAK